MQSGQNIKQFEGVRIMNGHTSKRNPNLIGDGISTQSCVSRNYYAFGYL